MRIIGHSWNIKCESNKTLRSVKKTR